MGEGRRLRFQRVSRTRTPYCTDTCMVNGNTEVRW